MIDLDRALADIHAVKAQLARGSEFRGYGPVAFAATGGLAIAGAVVQAWWIGQPHGDVQAYLGLWVAVAVLSAIIIGLDVVTRSRRLHSGFADEMIQAAVEQLLPSLVAGALVTFVIWHFAPRTLWMMPGLWQVMLSLGVFSACRSLPAPMICVAFWYLSSGLACLAFANGAWAFSPWAMGLPFGCGQFLAAFLIQSTGGRDAEA